MTYTFSLPLKNRSIISSFISAKQLRIPLLCYNSPAMKKKNIVLVIMIMAVIVLAYFTGYDACEQHYKNYYNAVEVMLDSINSNDMLDVIMETDEYNNYIKAKEEL